MTLGKESKVWKEIPVSSDLFPCLQRATFFTYACQVQALKFDHSIPGESALDLNDCHG